MNWFREAVDKLLHPDAGGRPATERLTILAVTASPQDRATLVALGAAAEWRLLFSDNYESAVRMLNVVRPPVILYDRSLPEMPWRDSVRELSSRAPKSCVLLISAINSPYLWEEVVHCGGYDVVSTPIQAERLRHAVMLAWAHSRLVTQ